jgi:hypothetical protein
MATVSKHHGEQEGEGDDGVGSWRWDPQQPEVRTSSAPFPSQEASTLKVVSLCFLIVPPQPHPPSLVAPICPCVGTLLPQFTCALSLTGVKWLVHDPKVWWDLKPLFYLWLVHILSNSILSVAPQLAHTTHHLLLTDTPTPWGPGTLNPKLDWGSGWRPAPCPV